MSIFESLKQQLGPNAIAAISREIGADPGATAQAVPPALGSLIGALAGNATSRDGAASLLGALDRDHDGSVLDDLSGFLSDPQTAVGEGILGHVLGGKRAAVESGLAQTTGLDAGQIGKLLALLAPLVLGALGKKRSGSGLDLGGLIETLSGEREAVARQAPEGLGALSGLLDQDGDGQVMDDVAKLGSGLLGSFFGKKS